jgi:hypothetical protein
MLYRRREIQADIFILVISTQVLDHHQHVFTDGNAASRDTFFSASRDVINNSIDVLHAKHWNDFEDGKRKRCAEVLVYPLVEPEFIDHIICYDSAAQKYIEKFTSTTAIPDRSYYF